MVRSEQNGTRADSSNSYQVALPAKKYEPRNGHIDSLRLPTVPRKIDPLHKWVRFEMGDCLELSPYKYNFAYILAVPLFLAV